MRRPVVHRSDALLQTEQALVDPRDASAGPWTTRPPRSEPARSTSERRPRARARRPHRTAPAGSRASARTPRSRSWRRRRGLLAWRERDVLGARIGSSRRPTTVTPLAVLEHLEPAVLVEEVEHLLAVHLEGDGEAASTSPAAAITSRAAGVEAEGVAVALRRVPCPAIVHVFPDPVCPNANGGVAAGEHVLEQRARRRRPRSVGLVEDGVARRAATRSPWRGRRVFGSWTTSDVPTLARHDVKVVAQLLDLSIGRLRTQTRMRPPRPTHRRPPTAPARRRAAPRYSRILRGRPTRCRRALGVLRLHRRPPPPLAPLSR